MQKKDPRLERAGVSGFNKPKRTPSHPTKSHVVVAKEGSQVKLIRFGQQSVKTNDRGGAILNLNSTDHVMICLDGICVVADLSSFKDWNFSNTNERTEITLVFY